MTCNPGHMRITGLQYFLQTMLNFWLEVQRLRATVWIISTELVLASVSDTFYLLGMNLSVLIGG